MSDYATTRTKLGDRLNRLRRNPDPAEQLRLLKRYLSHFVKLLQCPRHFEAPFGEHLQLVVDLLNDRREQQPVDIEVLGTIIKTVCVVCCITAIPYQTVVIGLRGLVDIFERISSKETLGVMEETRNHLRKMVAQIKHFGYYQIHHLLVEIVFISSQAFTVPAERKDYVEGMNRAVKISWEQLLTWDSTRLAARCRGFLVDSQRETRIVNVLSLPVDECQLDKYRLSQASTGERLWLDVNLDPATLHLSAFVAMSHDDKSMQIAISLEILQEHIVEIEAIESNDPNHRSLRVRFTDFTIEPNIMRISKQGCVVFKLSRGFDWDYLRREILPEFRSHAPRKTPSLNSSRREGLLNISLLESVYSEPPEPTGAGGNSNNSNHSLWSHDNAETIQRHQNIRRKLLEDDLSEESNKENAAPNDAGVDLAVLVVDAQRSHPFDALREECRRYQELRSSKPTKKSISKPTKKRGVDRTDEKKSSPKQTRSIDAKKRRLFKEELEHDELNASKDSQIQRNKYVEKKLINAVRPMSLDDIKPEILPDEVVAFQENDLPALNESSDMMSSEELEQSLQAYINNNGIFGITQQKILDKKLEKNIRIINRMVDRTTKKFFKRELPQDNPYEFVVPDGEISKQNKSRKGKKSVAGGGSRGKPKKDNDDDFVPKSKSKSAKNTSNAARQRSKKSTVPKAKEDPKPSRASLPRAKKPAKFVEPCDSDDELSPQIFQSLEVSPNKADQPGGVKSKCYDRVEKTKVPLAKSTHLAEEPKRRDHQKAKEDPKPSRASLPCAKKPAKFIDLCDSDDGEEAAATLTPQVFESFEVSSIRADKPSGVQSKRYDAVAKTKVTFAKSTPIDKDAIELGVEHFAEEPKQRVEERHCRKRTSPTSSLESEDSDEADVISKTFVVGKPRSNKKSSSSGIPLAIKKRNAGILLRRDYKKSMNSPLKKTRQEKEKSFILDLSLPESEELSSQTSLTIRLPMRFSQANSLALDNATKPVDASVPSSLQVNTSVPVPSPKPDFKYAEKHFMLNKFITGKGNEQIKEPAVEIADSSAIMEQSLDIRAGLDHAVPPSSLEDGYYPDNTRDISQSPCYPARSEHQTPQSTPVRTAKQEKRKRTAEDRLAVEERPKRVALCEVPTPIVISKIVKMEQTSTVSLTPRGVMVDEFKRLLHHDLSPSMDEMEHKIAKLNEFSTQKMQRISANLHSKEIAKKCDEIEELESRLDELIGDVAKLCQEAVEGNVSKIEYAKNVVQYDEHKRNEYKDRIRSGQQEMEVIVNNCMKSVWNNQIHASMEQLESLLRNSLM